MRRLIDGQLATLKEIGRRIEQLEAEVGALQKHLDKAVKLRQVPGIGPLGATALAATLGDGRGWRSRRQFSGPAWGGGAGQQDGPHALGAAGARARVHKHCAKDLHRASDYGVDQLNIKEGVDGAKSAHAESMK